MSIFFDNEIFQKLDFDYQNAVKKLEKDYHTTNDLKNKINVIIDFTTKYLAAKEIFDFLFSLIMQDEDSPDFYELQGKLIKRSLNHFYFNHDIPGFNRYRWKFLHERKITFYGKTTLYSDKELADIDHLAYPHINLENNFRLLEEFSSKPLSKTIIEKFYAMQNLYSDIIKSEDDNKKWFNLILQSTDTDFMVTNIEDRLGKNLNNKELWKLYIDFLRQRDKKKMLSIYSRYCRYFLSDKNIKAEYQAAAIESYGPSIVAWKNPFEFEIYQETEDLLDTPRDNEIMPNIEPCPKFQGTFDTYQIQEFSLPKTILTYLLQKKSPEILHKLHQSCKYFFIILPYPVCHRFCCQDSFYKNVEFYQQSLGIHSSENANFQHQLILSNSLHLCHLSDSYYLSKLIKNFYECHIKYLSIGTQNLTEKEYKFLVEHGNVESLNLKDVNIYDEHNKLMPMERILSFVPKVIEISFCNPFTTSETSLELSKIKFLNKIVKFELTKMDLLEPYDFLGFVKKNFEPFFDIHIVFKIGIDGSQFGRIIYKEMENLWNKKSDYHLNIHRFH